jgi:hypothetical protein
MPFLGIGKKKKVDPAKLEAKKKAADLKVRTGLAPSEMSDTELAAHKKSLAKNPPMTIQKKPASGLPLGLGANPFGSSMQMRAATAGTTARGMQPAMSPTATDTGASNFLGSGPNPAAANNALMSIKKKIKI